jgi:colanic acid biosynthesis glycosyl transferase WcaI
MRPFLRFSYIYFLQRGFLDGIEGYYFARLHACYEWMSLIKTHNTNGSFMRIVVWGINYAPEEIGIGPCNVALCEYLAQRGSEVSMLTAFPYYPGWKKRHEDAHRLFRTEIVNGVRVLRCWLYVPKRTNTSRRLLHELSFVTFSFVRLLFIPRSDLLIVVSPPLLLGVAARFLCFLRGGRYLLHLQDLQPDAAINLGMAKSSMLVRVFKTLASIAYRGAWRISGVSRGMLDVLRKRGVPEAKLRCFPNGTYPVIQVPKGRFRALNCFDPDKFLVIYSGNIGVKQGLEQLILAIRSVRNPAVQMIICGNGAQKKPLLEMAAGVPNIWFKGMLNVKDYREMLTDADLMVVSVVSGSGSSFFPSKLLSACAAGKPVVAICDADSELAMVVERNHCGVVVQPGDAGGLARWLEQLSSDPKQLEPMGRAAKELGDRFLWSDVLEKFTKEAGICTGSAEDNHWNRREIEQKAAKTTKTANIKRI